MNYCCACRNATECKFCGRSMTACTAEQKDKTELCPIPIIGDFGNCWVVDVVGPGFEPTARRRNRYILVCVDQATRFTQLFALRNLKSETVTDVLVNQLFARYGAPNLRSTEWTHEPSFPKRVKIIER